MKKLLLLKLGIALMVALSIICFVRKAVAGIPEPDVIFYGMAKERGFMPTKSQISLILNEDAALIASYLPGSVNEYGEKYVLKVPMDALSPKRGKGVSFYIGEELAAKSVIPQKGSVIEINLDTLYTKDSDGDFMDDNWELQYFGSLDRDGTGDFNGNGISDLDEYRAGNDPTESFWQLMDETHCETCISNSLMLKKALAEAGGDSHHNLIKVQTGTYPGNFVYIADADEGFDLVIVGGYGAGCAVREVNPDATVLDGDVTGDGIGDGTVFSLDTGTNQTKGCIHIEGFYIKNGSAENDSGGGININNGQGGVSIMGNKITDCIADDGAGVRMYSDAGSVTIVNNTLLRNTGREYGGGVSLWAGSEALPITVINNTFNGNSSSNGGGIYYYSSYASPKIMNNIITNSKDGKAISIEGGTVPCIDYNNLWKNAAGNYNNVAFRGEHDLSVNPYFMDTVNDNYLLGPDSPCIDAGFNDPVLPDTDQLGEKRIMDGDDDNIFLADMGAYEVIEDLIIDCDPKIDMDCDGVINDEDQCPGVDDTYDADEDNIPDCIDEFVDSDADGIDDNEDKCPGFYDPNDADGDGMPDGCDRCPNANDTIDSDIDNIPDCLDDFIDSDIDGVADSEDICPGFDDTNDVDGDFIPDGCDLCYGFDDAIDSDQDSIPDGCDLCEGSDDLIDIDADGIPDGCDSFITSANNPPAKPLLDLPVDGGTVMTLRPELRTKPFSDPDEGDAHAMSHWQISTTYDFSSLVLDIKSSFCLTGLTVLDFVLNPGKTYFWRVRFYDSHNTPSQWSEINLFKTDPALSEVLPDKFRVSDTVDIDFDGYSDNTQPDEIKTVTTLDGNVRIGVRVPKGCTIISIKPVDLNDIYYAHNRPDVFPIGLISFKLVVPDPGDQVSVTIYFSAPVPEKSRWYKYDQAKGWYDYSQYAGFMGEKSIIITLTDGGAGDGDGVKNGIIIDPSGPGIISGMDSGDSTGCFIDVLLNGE